MRNMDEPGSYTHLGQKSQIFGILTGQFYKQYEMWEDFDISGANQLIEFKFNVLYVKNGVL